MTGTRANRKYNKKVDKKTNSTTDNAADNTVDSTASDDQYRTSVPSKWGRAYLSSSIKPFGNPRIFAYRDVVISMLLHTPLLVNWIQINHILKHADNDCNKNDMDLLCSFHRLISIYWLEDKNYSETLKHYIDCIWKKIRKTTWTDLHATTGLKSWVFLRKVFQQLRAETKDNKLRGDELQRYFYSELKWSLPSSSKCQHCDNVFEESLRSVENSLVASCDPLAEERSYDVADAVSYQLELATRPSKQACTNCGRTDETEAETTKLISHLPEVLFVQYDKGDLNIDCLKLQDTMTIPIGFQEDTPGREEVRYELYSVIFHYYGGESEDGGRKGIAKKVTKANRIEPDICAVRGPETGKWALIKSNSVKSFTSLKKLLEQMDQVDREHLTYGLAYRRLPLTIDKNCKGIEVFMKQTIEVREGVKVTFEQPLQLPGIDRLIDLQGKTKHVGHIDITLMSNQTQECLEGDAIIKLAKRKYEGPLAAATTAKRRRDTPSDKADISKAATRPPTVAGSSKPTKARTLFPKTEPDSDPDISQTTKGDIPARTETLEPFKGADKPTSKEARNSLSNIESIGESASSQARKQPPGKGHSNDSFDSLFDDAVRKEQIEQVYGRMESSASDGMAVLETILEDKGKGRAEPLPAQRANTPTESEVSEEP